VAVCATKSDQRTTSWGPGLRLAARLPAQRKVGGEREHGSRPRRLVVFAHEHGIVVADEGG
jgi:hypothetical protein